MVTNYKDKSNQKKNKRQSMKIESLNFFNLERRQDNI